MDISFDDDSCELILASDVIHDGVWLEFYDVRSESLVMAVFYSDVTQRMSFYAYRQNLPLEVVGRFIRKAKEALPPKSQPETSL
jgi:hypothetical protein